MTVCLSVLVGLYQKYYWSESHLKITKCLLEKFGSHKSLKIIGITGLDTKQ